MTREHPLFVEGDFAFEHLRRAACTEAVWERERDSYPILYTHDNTPLFEKRDSIGFQRRD